MGDKQSLIVEPCSDLLWEPSEWMDEWMDKRMEGSMNRWVSERLHASFSEFRHEKRTHGGMDE